MLREKRSPSNTTSACLNLNIRITIFFLVLIVQPNITNMLRISFDQAIDSKIIQILHNGGLNHEGVSDIKNLIEKAGGEKLEPIYQLSKAEIIHNNYGFAHAFKLYLKPGIDIERSIEILQTSPLIEKVEPIGINRTFNSAFP